MYMKVDTSKEDFELAVRIVDRFTSVVQEVGIFVSPEMRMTLVMDLEVAHKFNPLRLDEMLKGREEDLVHDVGGIHQHLNRQTGKLEDFFLPRYSRMEDDDDTD